MTLARALRILAWLIAIAAFVDPVITAKRDVQVPISVVTVRTASLDLPMADGVTRRATLDRAVEGLESRLGSAYRVLYREQAPDSADGCAGAEACVWVGDDTAAPAHASVSMPQFALIAADPLSPNVAVRNVSAAQIQHAEAFGRMRVSLEGHGVAGARTDVRVLDDGRELGVTTHTWLAGETEADVTVDWWPVHDGLRRITVEAVPLDPEVSDLDNRVSVVVHVTRAQLPVLIYEPRPSFATTFVRRALEADSRLRVDARSRVSPRTSVTTPAAPALTAASLDEVALVVVGGLEALSNAEAGLLRRYVERRGGALLLLPDRLPSGPAARLMPNPVEERLVGQPEAAGVLRATEWAVTRAPDPVDRVLASLDSGAAVVVESRVGRGRIVVSGAMDAWRHRGLGDGFEEFWRALAAGLAAGTGAALDVRPRATAVVAGEAVVLEVEDRSLLTPADAWPPVEAWLTCQDEEQTPLTVWPAAAPGTYRIDASAARAGVCAVEVATADGGAVAPVSYVDVVETRAEGAAGPTGSLTRIARSRAGAAFGVEQLDRLASAVVEAAPRRREPSEVHPFRTGWWILVFAGALGGEWWLRRRNGQR